MQAALLCYTRRVPIANSQRGAWMKVLKNSLSPARTKGEGSRWGVAFAAVLAMLVGVAITANGQAPRTMVIRPGRVLNVRTRDLRANQVSEIEGDKMPQITPPIEVTERS